MKKTRSNESIRESHNHTHRTSRGYEINGQWYFELRNGGQKGPFSCETDMQTQLNEFIRLHDEMNQLN